MRVLRYMSLASLVALAACADESRPGAPGTGLRIGNAGYGGSQSLLDSRTTTATFSGGTPDDVGYNAGSIFGPYGLRLGVGDLQGDSTSRLLDPRSTGAEGSGGTPSATGGAGGARR